VLPTVAGGVSVTLERGSPDRRGGYWTCIEGGVVIFLALLIVVGGGIISLWLLATGGRLRKRQLEGELDDDAARSRPVHTTPPMTRR
jgi:hypothetical protein